jgi:hypothetical protein
MVRLAYFCTYVALAALAEALVAGPALLWVQSQGILRPALAWAVPFGALLVCSALAVALFAIWLASRAALGRRPVLPLHVAFLLLVGTCSALRFACGDARSPPDPMPSLLDALRASAEELDRRYAGSYAPDAAQLSSALAQVPAPPFRRLGRRLPLHARILAGAEGAQLEALGGDDPGTIYVAISSDRQSAWLTALSLSGLFTLPSGRPAVAEAHSGTHANPGTDPAMPTYPQRGRN